uniref:ceramidase n=1 Tax=Heterorhabditis bacteriophora TaxID=37862 RepID=A0A1I7XKK3_HETBA
MNKWFEYESGHAWCESAYKYQTLPMIAEFGNTVLNFRYSAVSNKRKRNLSIVGTPYLHALFHLLAGVAGYTIFVMFSMIDIETRINEHRFSAAVRYFPDKSGSLFSFPYISLREKAE